MRYLLDTHIFIWVMEKNRRLTRDVQNIISDSNNEVFISLVTIWEIVLKKRKGLKIPKDIIGGIRKSNFTLLSIDVNHVLGVEKLSDIHKDPFDRILVSQAKEEKLTLITSDPKIWRYKLSLLKA